MALIMLEHGDMFSIIFCNILENEELSSVLYGTMLCRPCNQWLVPGERFCDRNSGDSWNIAVT